LESTPFTPTGSETGVGEDLALRVGEEEFDITK
jgi:hypothetical protein